MNLSLCWVPGFPVMQKTQETLVGSLHGEDPLEEGVVTHSSILAWEIPWTEERGGLQVCSFTKSWTWLNQLSTYWALYLKTPWNACWSTPLLSLIKRMDHNTLKPQWLHSASLSALPCSEMSSGVMIIWNFSTGLCSRCGWNPRYRHREGGTLWLVESTLPLSWLLPRLTCKLWKLTLKWIHDYLLECMSVWWCHSPL